MEKTEITLYLLHPTPQISQGPKTYSPPQTYPSLQTYPSPQIYPPPKPNPTLPYAPNSPLAPNVPYAPNLHYCPKRAPPQTCATPQTHPSSGLVIMQLNHGRDVTTPPLLAPPGIHELLGLPVAEVDVVAAAPPLPLAVRGHVAGVVVAGALQQSAQTTGLCDGVHHTCRRDGVQESRLPGVCQQIQLALTLTAGFNPDSWV